MRLISKSLGTDTEGDSCFRINQTDGFYVCRSSFFVHLTNFLFHDIAKQAAILKTLSGGEYPRIYHV